MNRREALRTIGISAAAGSILAGGTAIAVAAHIDAHPDAALLTLGEELERAWKAEAVMNVRNAVTDDEADALTGRSSTIIDQIIAMPCRTIDGVRVKLRAISWCSEGPLPSEYLPDRILILIVENLGVSTAPAWRAA